MARRGGGSTRKTGTKVSAKKLPVSTSGKSHKTPKMVPGQGGSSKIGSTK